MVELIPPDGTSGHEACQQSRSTYILKAWTELKVILESENQKVRRQDKEEEGPSSEGISSLTVVRHQQEESAVNKRQCKRVYDQHCHYSSKCFRSA